MSVLTITIDNDKEYTLNNEDTVDEQLFKCDWLHVSENRYHVICNNKSYSIEIIESDYTNKEFLLKINGELVKASAKDEYDQLLHTLGMDTSLALKLNEIKAPMPGMVLDVIAQNGSVVNKGDSLLILEAMKMENIIKSPGDGLVKQIKIKKGDKVEKNQILITFA